MDRNINPVAAFFVIAAFIALAGLYFYIDFLAINITGPSRMHVDGRGGLHILTGNRIFQFDKNARFVREIDLEKVGIQRLAGDFAILENGDILLSPNSFQLDPRDDFLGFFKSGKDAASTAKGSEGGLMRCGIVPLKCRPFGDLTITLDKMFDLRVDYRNGWIFLADSNNHVVRMLDREGRQLHVNSSGWKYPNHLYLEGNRLYVVDTWHRVVKTIDVAQFDKVQESIPVIKNAENRPGHTWPLLVGRAGRHWWTGLLVDSWDKGDMYVYNEDWTHGQAAYMPPGSEPFDLVTYNDEVLVSDPMAMVVYRYTAALPYSI